MRYFLRFILLALMLQCVQAQSFNSKLSAKLQVTLDSLVTMFSNNTKGVSAAVYVPGQGIWKGVSGISYPGKPLTSDMAFGIASNTKLFTAVAVLKLVDGKVLSLSDPLSKWIPSYKNINSSITVRQLLNHTSGVSDPFLTTALLDTVQAHPTRVYTPQDVLALVGAPSFNPGASYGYSNINYILAGMVVKSATGVSISKIMRDSLLNPLGLKGTFYDIEEAEIGTVAYRWHRSVDIHDSSRISLNTSGGPAGSIFSTSEDIAAWYAAIMSGKVLTTSSFDELTKFLSPQAYAMGLQKTTFFARTTWGHGGSTVGYKSRVIHDPCMHATVCCLSNDDWSAVDGITALLYKVLVDFVPNCAGAVSGAATVCQGQGSLTYTVPAITNATSYVWTLPQGLTGSSTTNSIVVSFDKTASSGEISVRGTNEYGEGVGSAHSITVNKVNRGVSLSGLNVKVDSLASSYQWLDCDKAYKPIVGATAQSYTASSKGRYAAQITNGSCVDTSECMEVIVNDVPSDEIAEFTISPHPFHEQTRISFAHEQAHTLIRIVDAIGRELRSIQFSGSQCIIEKGDLKAGVYCVQLINEQKTTLSRVLVVY